MTNSHDKEDNRKYSNDSAQQNNGYNFYNAIKEDTTKIVNEIAKTQPAYIQAISNLQMRFIEGTKNINNFIEFNNINNKFISNVFEVAGDGIKNYTKTLDTIVKFNANVFEQWYSLFKNNQNYKRT